MDWKDWLWVSTQLSIVTFCITGIIASLIFAYLGIVIIKGISSGKNYVSYKAAQFEEASANIKEAASNFSSNFSPLASALGVALGIFGVKKTKSSFAKFMKGIFK